jgi:predicted Co/Zn/Cd cation transporter (cation efflux family)
MSNYTFEIIYVFCLFFCLIMSRHIKNKVKNTEWYGTNYLVGWGGFVPYINVAIVVWIILHNFIKAINYIIDGGE